MITQYPHWFTKQILGKGSKLAKSGPYWPQEVQLEPFFGPWDKNDSPHLSVSTVNYRSCCPIFQETFAQSDEKCLIPKAKSLRRRKLSAFELEVLHSIYPTHYHETLPLEIRDFRQKSTSDIENMTV